MKALAFLAIILGIMAIMGPFNLVSQTRGAATQPGAREALADPIIFPYIVVSTVLLMLLGIAQVAFAMFALQLREVARKGLLVSSALILLAILADLYIGYVYAPSLRQRVASTQGEMASPYVVNIPNLIWLVVSGGILYVYNQAFVRQLFSIATNVRKRAKEGGDVRTASES